MFRTLYRSAGGHFEVQGVLSGKSSPEIDGAQACDTDRVPTLADRLRSRWSQKGVLIMVR